MKREQYGSNTLKVTPCSCAKKKVLKMRFHLEFKFLTSTVHDFPYGGSRQDVLAAQVVSQLATDGHDDGHHQMRQGRQYANLQPHTKSDTVSCVNTIYCIQYDTNYIRHFIYCDL